MTSQIDISIVVPIFNSEEYLSDCIESLFNQKFTNIEIICIDDCSSDKSLVLLRKYSKKDSRLKIISHAINKGLAAARNSGIKAAKGKYIYFIDSDDFLSSNEAIGLLHQEAVSHNADEVIGGIFKWNPIIDEYYLDWHSTYLKKEEHGKSLFELPQLKANVIACNKLIRLDLLTKNNVWFNEKLRKYEDNPFSCIIHMLSKKISILTKNTYIYRQSETGNIMASLSKADAIYRSLYCFDIFRFIESNTRFHIYRNIYYQMYSWQLISSANILSKFAPSYEDKKNLFDVWLKSINLIKNDYPDIPEQQKEIFGYVINGDIQKAWIKSIQMAYHNNTDNLKSIETILNRSKEVSTKIENYRN